MIRLFLFLLTALFSITVNALSPIEKQIRDNITQNQPDALALLETLVNINSGTTNLNGINQIKDIVQTEFKKLGFTTQWIESPPEMHRAGMLLAERLGSRGNRLLLIGHLDTVFPSTSPFQHFERKGNFATGPGVTDDKGGIITILYALKALNAIHALDHATIYVALTGDEEDSGKPTTISRKTLKDIAKQSDIALDFEPSVNKGTATIARRGINDWVVETQGIEGHSSQIFQQSVGDGALFELARILNTFRIQLADEKYLSFNPGMALGGTKITYDKNASQGFAFGKPNVIASLTLARGDLRFLTLEQQKSAQNKMMAIVNQHLPKTTATITFQPGIPPMAPTQANLTLLKKYSNGSIDLGLGEVKPIDPSLKGAADISHVALMVKANLSGIGPVGTGEHSEKETLDISSLNENTQRAAILIYRLIQ